MLIVIDGLDGSGKSTQADRVAKRIRRTGKQVKLISFPDYSQPSSALVKMYLNGELSQSADGVNAYAASSFYAVDRYASFKKFWEQDYRAGTVILASRYVTSNMMHQMSKLPEDRWPEFMDWLRDFEYNRLGLPQPNKVIYLDMPRPVADRLLLSRYQGDEAKKDLHEQNREYMARCEKAARYAAKADGWTVIRCSEGEEPLPVETVEESLWREIEYLLL